MILNSIQRPIETAFSVHVLSVSPLHRDVNLSVVISLHFLVLGGVEARNPHDFHHLDLLIGFPFKVPLSEQWSCWSRSGVAGLVLTASTDTAAPRSLFRPGSGPEPVPLLLSLPPPLPGVVSLPPPPVIPDSLAGPRPAARSSVPGPGGTRPAPPHYIILSSENHQLDI